MKRKRHTLPCSCDRFGLATKIEDSRDRSRGYGGKALDVLFSGKKKDTALDERETGETVILTLVGGTDKTNGICLCKSR